MHIVAATRDTQSLLHSVLTANTSADQIRPVLTRMEPVGSLSAPGPARVATVELPSGRRVSLVFHERKDFIEILMPVTTGVESELADLLVELDIPADAVTWVHEELDQHAVLARLAAASHR